MKNENWKTVRLGDLISKADIIRNKSQNYPILSMTMHEGLIFQKDRFSKQIASIDRSNYLVVKRNQLVQSFPIDEGVLDINRVSDLGIVSPAYKIWNINETQIYGEYLVKVLRCEKSLSFYKQKLKGTTARRRTISDADFLGMQIPLPPLEEQKHIAAVLDKCSALIAKQKRMLEKYDTLVKSQFVEMFGDPYSNPMNWERKTFKEVAVRLSDGPFGSNLKSEHYSSSGIRVIRLGNIGVNEFLDADKAFIPLNHYETLKKYTCKAGEIVIGTMGVPNLRACIIPDKIPISINKADCVHYIPKPELLDTRFVCQYINCPETLLLASSMIHGQTRTRVSSGQIAEMPISIPPLALQEKFAAFVQAVDAQKAKAQKSLDKAETLYKALMQEYFG